MQICLIFSTVALLGSISIKAQLRVIRLPSFCTSSDKVALHSIVCRSGSVIAISSEASSIKPCLSISSTSSKTRYLTPPRLVLPLRIWSKRRPGVPIKTWLLPSSLCFCASKSRPPVTASTFTSLPPNNFFSSTAICCASSRVGVITNACTKGLAASRRSTIGTKNASVLPVPVCALAITSRPANKAGIACSWTGIGFLIPICLSSSTVSAQTFNSAKLFTIFLTAFISNPKIK